MQTWLWLRRVAGDSRAPQHPRRMQVLRMLRQAQEVMDKGLMTPVEMEAHLVAHLAVSGPRQG